MPTLYAIAKSTGKILTFTDVTGIAYSDETVYEGETYRHEFSDSNSVSGEYKLDTDSGGLTHSSPDSVMKIAPRKLAVKRSIITLTCTFGGGTMTHKLYRDAIRFGGLTNINPATLTASGDTLYGLHKASGKWMAWGLVSSIAYSNESIFEGDHYRNEFSLSKALSGDGYVEDEAGTDVMPDSVSKTAPGHEEKDKSIITITTTAGGGSLALRLFRDEMAGGCLQNTDPFA